jgi:hypothetical protein
MCIIDGCSTKPVFNIEGEKPKYCKKHKTNIMKDVVTKKCIYDGCKTAPSFNYLNLKTPLYCSKHKLENMCDIKTKKCLYEQCLLRFGLQTPP